MSMAAQQYQNPLTSPFPQWQQLSKTSKQACSSQGVKDAEAWNWMCRCLGCKNCSKPYDTIEMSACREDVRKCWAQRASQWWSTFGESSTYNSQGKYQLCKRCHTYRKEQAEWRKARGEAMHSESMHFAKGSCKRLMQKARAKGSCKRLMEKAHATGSCKRLVRKAFGKGSCKRLVQKALVKGSCKGLMQKAHAKGSCKRLMQKVYAKGSRKRLMQKCKSGKLQKFKSAKVHSCRTCKNAKVGKCKSAKGGLKRQK